MYIERRIKRSEALQLILLDCLYTQSGTHRIIFQGGTALRWIYGGVRFSEDLDFVTDIANKQINDLLEYISKKAHQSCIAQFGQGQSELRSKKDHAFSTKVFFVYSPSGERERIAIKLEFESLRKNHQLRTEKVILRDLPLASMLITEGKVILPYSSSIVIAETVDEIFTDKIRALYERKYIKGRDIYDIWWLVKHRAVKPNWERVREKLYQYNTPFVPSWEAEYFEKKENDPALITAIERDLSRFLPGDIFKVYQEKRYTDLITTLHETISILTQQGMRNYFREHFIKS